MFKSIQALASISILLMLSGCAGTDFVRPSQDAFKLGRTTYAEVVKQLGEPRREGTLLKNEKNLKSITYAFAASGGEPLEKDVIPARAMSYYFLDSTLVGQEFVSSFKDDHSNFDDTKVSAIIKGKTTRSEVTKLLGRASGSYIPPVVKATSGEAMGYTYVTTSGGVLSGFKFFRKALLVSFDERDLVSDVDYSTSGSR